MWGREHCQNTCRVRLHGYVQPNLAQANMFTLALSGVECMLSYLTLTTASRKWTFPIPDNSMLISSKYGPVTSGSAAA